jgi:hypothetical protein
MMRIHGEADEGGSFAGVTSKSLPSRQQWLIQANDRSTIQRLGNI